jgi:leader peptidase (prepilin peptidase)/N-methyltransferase
VLVVTAAVVEREWSWITAAAIGALGLTLYYGLLWFISPRIMAFGDVRLGAMIGLALGPFGLGTLLLSVLAAGVVGALTYLPMRYAGRTIKRHVPFGPFLLAGAVVAVVASQWIAASVA